MKKIIVAFTFFLVFKLCFSQVKEYTSILEVETIVCNDYPIEDFEKRKQFQTIFKKDKELNSYMSFDTIYVYLESKNYTKGIVTKYSEVFKPHKIWDTTIFYTLKVKNNFSLPSLVSKKYYDFDAMEIDSSTYIKNERKNFLYIKRRQILKSSNFTKTKTDDLLYTNRAFYEIITTRKKVYIIDESENKNDMITIRYFDIPTFISEFSFRFF